MEELSEISYALQNPETTESQMEAWAGLLTILEADPTNVEASDLYLKYKNLGRDWSKEIQSI